MSAARARNLVGSRPGARPTALIVEDEGLIALDLQHCLEQLGFEVLATVDTCTAALRSAGERRPDVVLMDIHIKGAIDGIDTAAMLRERFEVPVVFLTAYADAQTIARALQSSPYGYIVKPFTVGDVRTAVEIARHRHALDVLLAERERWFSTTLRSISDAVVACDDRGRVRFVNHAAERLTGWTETEASGRSITEVVRVRNDGDQREGENPAIRALRERAPHSASRAVWLVDRGGERARMIEQSAAPILHAESLLGAVMVFRDVTEERRMQEQLALTDRLTSLGTMAAGVGHEINNPLSSNLSNIDFALQRLRDLQRAANLPELAEVLEALAEARAGGDRIAVIVADLCAFSRSQEEQHRAVDVRSCVEWALRLTANQLRHAARLVTELERVPGVLGNEVRLSQVFVNLLVHASQAIVGASERNEIRVVTRTDAGGRAVVEIHDSGVGMAPETVARIFDRFTQSPGTGAGLGLSICCEIVEWMGGRLELVSELGRGSCFTVTLPPGASARAQEVALQRDAPVAQSLRILVIEDDDLLARALSRMLGRQHDVTVCAGGEQGLARLREDPRFDLVLCDMMMPGMSGMEVYEEIVHWRPALARRMVFMTGGAFTPRTAEFLATVPNPTLGKPFSKDAMLAVLYARLAELGPAEPAAIDPDPGAG